MLRATVVYLFIGLYVVIMAPIGIIWSFATKNNGILYCLARFCIRVAGWMCQVNVTIQGREKIAPETTYVFLSNHQGNFDGPVLFHAIPQNWKALIKKEMMRIPILSFVLKHAQFVPIERSDPKRAHTSIDLGAKLLMEGHSFIAFPEGTRSRDGRLGEFKRGVFIMAIKAQVPIIPITIRNSAKIQPPGSFAIRPGCIEVVIHDPIPTKGLSMEDRNRLVQQARDAIIAGL